MNELNIIICPGIHPPQFTQDFVQNLQASAAWRQQDLSSRCDRLLVIPSDEIAPYDPWQMIQYLNDLNVSPPALWIGFSAGVVGAMGAAWQWQQQGNNVPLLMALDGWGMPKLGNFPVYRLSHDHFTHWSSAFLGAYPEGFYADPAVEHLELWRSPQTAWGWWVKPSPQGEIRTYTNAAEVIVELLSRGFQS